MPRVTIGVPVFNGAALIGECLENLAQQTFNDFEVVISDNASTDNTMEICEKFAQKDARFRVIHQATTSTAIQNFVAVRNAAKSPLYMWRAFDDLSTANYIEALVAVHDNEPNISLAVPKIKQIFGVSMRERHLNYHKAFNGPTVLKLLQRMLQMKAGWFYGLWRHDAASMAIDEVFSEFPDDWAADYLALFHAALHGGISGTNDCTFSHRLIPEVRDYIPRPKPCFDEMVDRNRRYSLTCQKLLDGTGFSATEAMFIRTYIPFFTNRCSHRGKRVAQAAFRKMRGI